MSDTSTRSGMLWEVERILTECKELGSLPQILLMENVVQVHSSATDNSKGNVEDFNKWQLRLQELGYSSYWEDLIATDYGIPQTRNRCFMISILGEYSYSFPPKQPLKLKLKDMLEDNVDEKYYLSDKMKQYIFSEDDKYKVNKNSLKLNREIACSKTTREGWTRADTSDYITDEVINTYDEYNHKINGNETIGTIQAMYSVPNHGHRLIIKNATAKGYLEATDGDGIDISSRMEYQRGNVQKGKAQTLSTMGGENVGVVVKPKVLGGIGEKDSNSNTQWKQQNRVYDDNVSISVTTSFNPYYCVGTYQYAKSDKFMNGKNRLQIGKETADTIQTSQKEGIVNSDLRIRKLTPRECGRLMNVKDEDIYKILKNQSDSSAYHLFGDSICTNVLMAIFGELLDIDWKAKLEEMLNGNI